MKTREVRTARGPLWEVLLITTLAVVSLQAGVQTGKVFVKSVNGDVQYVEEDGVWKPLAPNTSLGGGTSITTAADATADLLLTYNGSVWRMTPNTTLRLEKLEVEKAGEETITQTKLRLVKGAIVGSQRKLAKPSVLQIDTPNGAAIIRGTEYLVRADGAVTVLSGVVWIHYNLPGNRGSIKVTIHAGQSFDPATGTVVPTTPEFLQNIIAHVDTVRNNAEVFKAGGATVVVKPEGEVSPTRPRGNNGVGNGVDPQPPGNPPINDGPGTGPGNPGNRGGANK